MNWTLAQDSQGFMRGKPIKDMSCTQCWTYWVDWICSMCYWDIDHNTDWFYRQWAEEQSMMEQPLPPELSEDNQ